MTCSRKASIISFPFQMNSELLSRVFRKGDLGVLFDCKVRFDVDVAQAHVSLRTLASCVLSMHVIKMYLSD